MSAVAGLASRWETLGRAACERGNIREGTGLLNCAEALREALTADAAGEETHQPFGIFHDTPTGTDPHGQMTWRGREGMLVAWVTADLSIHDEPMGHSWNVSDLGGFTRSGSHVEHFADVLDALRDAAQDYQKVSTGQ